MGKLLIIDDDEDILTAGRLLLRREFGEVIGEREPEKVPDLMEEHDFDAILLDMNFGARSWLRLPTCLRITTRGLRAFRSRAMRMPTS